MRTPVSTSEKAKIDQRSTLAYSPFPARQQKLVPWLMRSDISNTGRTELYFSTTYPSLRTHRLTRSQPRKENRRTPAHDRSDTTSIHTMGLFVADTTRVYIPWVCSVAYVPTYTGGSLRGKYSTHVSGKAWYGLNIPYRTLLYDGSVRT